jgi:hypothetical protein
VQVTRGILVSLGVALPALAAYPEIRDTVRRATRPRTVTWLTWFLLTALSCAASASNGDYPAAAFSAIGTLTTLAVLIASLRYGDRSLGRLDIVCLVGVLAGLGLWRSLDQPAAAVLVACGVDLVGLVPTVATMWRRPGDETMATFGLIAAGAACAALAVVVPPAQTLSITSIAYPVYVAVSLGAACAVHLVRARVLRRVAFSVPDVPINEDVPAIAGEA